MMKHYEKENKQFVIKGLNGDFETISKRLQKLISREIAEYRDEIKTK